MGHNHSPQDTAHLNVAMDEDNVQDAPRLNEAMDEDNVQDTAHLNEAMDEDKDDIYLADADSEGSTVKMDLGTSPVENIDPMAFSVDSVDSTIDLDGDGFFLGDVGMSTFYDDKGYPLSDSTQRRSQRRPARRTAEEHSPPNISDQPRSPLRELLNDGFNNLSNVLCRGLSIDPAQAGDLANRLSANTPISHPIDQLGEQLNDLSINRPSDNEPGNDTHRAPSCIASDSGFDEFGMELIRWFKPSQIQGIPPNRLLVYNTRKQFSHVRKLKPHNFPFLSAGDTWVDEGTIVISIAADDRAEHQMPVAWGVHFGPDSRLNMWRPVRSMLPHNKKSACINAMQSTLGFVHTKIFCVDPEIHTVIIRNSSPWLTRAMTGGLELYNFGCHLPWLEGHQLLYLQYLRRLVGLMQSMTDHGTNPLKFRFWCVEPEANREAIELARRVYAGSRSTQM
ncbi:hypothetical protein MKX08_005693 [Trichoderma sp. CBMAI-0020]|nr:hypothetical protein MKX08_005693 [Trichoderma sp. CBMAI-0020]